MQRVVVCAGAVVSVCALTAAMNIAGYEANPTRYDRFETVGGLQRLTTAPDFLLAGCDHSAVGWVGELSSSNPRAYRRAVTLVTRRHIVFAWHYPAEVGAVVQFMEPSGTVHSARVTRVSRTTRSNGSLSDLAVGTLDTAIPPTVRPATIGPRDGVDYRDLPLYVMGTPGRVATNKLVSYWGNTWDFGPWAIVSQTSAPEGTGTSESGDSGSPTFVRIGNDLLLVGTRFSPAMDTWVPAFTSQIAAIVATDGESLTPWSVPACPVDLNADGDVDVDDVLLFVEAFTQQDAVADRFPDGVYDVNDIVVFVDELGQGC